MKKFLLGMMALVGSLSAMDTSIGLQQQQQEEMVTVIFEQQEEEASSEPRRKRKASSKLEGGAATKIMRTVAGPAEQDLKIPKKYVMLSVTLRNILNDIGGNSVFIPKEYKEDFKLLDTYFPKLYELHMAVTDQERSRITQELKVLLERKEQEYQQLGKIANISDYLDIESLRRITLSVCQDRLMSSVKLRNQFLKSDEPQDFNPFGLNSVMLSYLQEKIFASPAYALVSSFQGHNLPLNAVIISPNGEMLASTSSGIEIKLWQQRDGQWINVQTLMERVAWMVPLAFSPDGNTLASSSDRQIKLWQQRDGQWTNVKTLTGDHPVSLVFSPDGETLASGSLYDGTIKLWQQQNDQWMNVQTLRGDVGSGISVVFSPDGKMLASTSRDTTIKLWKEQSGQWKNMQPLRGHAGPVTSAVFSPDGKMLASASDDKTIKLWQQQDDQWINVQTLSGHTKRVKSVAFSSDGKMLASASDDKTIKLWQQQDDQWTNVQTLSGHRDMVVSVAFSSDGKLVSGSFDTTIKVWDKINVMTFQQALLLAYAAKIVVAKKCPLDIAAYPNLRPLFQSFMSANGHNFFDLIKPLIIDSSAQQQTSTMTSTITNNNN